MANDVRRIGHLLPVLDSVFSHAVPKLVREYQVTFCFVIGSVARRSTLSVLRKARAPGFVYSQFPNSVICKQADETALGDHSYLADEMHACLREA
jgi:hypothetical protein